MGIGTKYSVTFTLPVSTWFRESIGGNLRTTVSADSADRAHRAAIQRVESLRDVCNAWLKENA